MPQTWRRFLRCGSMVNDLATFVGSIVSDLATFVSLGQTYRGRQWNSTRVNQLFFSASRGWLENFLSQNHFSLRRRTTVSQSLPDQLINKASNFVLRVRKLRHIHQYPLSAIGNMDETPLWLDMPGDTTVARTGDRTISVKTTGHDKGRS